MTFKRAWFERMCTGEVATSIELALWALIILAAGITPIGGAVVALTASPSATARLVNWIGLTIGGELGVTFALFALLVAIEGPWRSPLYLLAYVAAAVAAVLGFRIIAIHRCRLRGLSEPATRTALHCLAFGQAVAAAMVPWILGAALPFGGGPFVPEYDMPMRADVHRYSWIVMPVAIGLLLEAWLLLCGSHSTECVARMAQASRLSALAGSLGLTGVVGCAALLLPGSRWDSHYHAKLERRDIRAKAARLDADRQRALSDIMVGRAPLLGPEPCPARYVFGEWQAWPSAHSNALDDPKSTSDYYRDGTPMWFDQTRASLWVAGPEAEGEWREYLPDGTSRFTREPPIRIQLQGPRLRAVLASMDEAEWREPWPDSELFVTPAEARGRVRAKAATQFFDSDASLVISRESPPIRWQDKTDLGTIEGSFWIWNYEIQGFVCGGDVRIEHATIARAFENYRDDYLRNGLRMRALARGVQTLRAVQHP
jgi:hypothetical protein